MPGTRLGSTGGRARGATGFLRAFISDGRTVGAVAATSGGLARRIAELAEIERATHVAELGAGTGAITRALLDALPADGRLWAFEIYPPFIEALRSELGDPRLTILGQPAAEIGELGEREVEAGFDAIVSSLPFSLMGAEETVRVLRAAAGALKPEGVFVALQYHPWFLAPYLRAWFKTVDRELYLWNIPAAHLLRGLTPRWSE